MGGNKLLNLIGFELQKFFHRKKNIISILIFVGVLIVFILLNSMLEMSVKQSKLNSLDSDMESVQNALKSVQDQLMIYPNDQELKDIENSYNKDISLISDIKQTYIEKEWNRYLHKSIELDRKSIDERNSGKTIGGEDISISQERIKKNTLLLNQNISPIEDKVSMEGYNSIKLILNSPMTLILVIVLVILCSDVVSSELEYNTDKLLYTQPIGKTTILLSKIIAVTCTVEVLTLGILGTVFVVLGLKNGFGNPNYPTEFLTSGGITYIPISKYIVYALLLLLLLIMFICSMAIFISSICKSTSSSISVSIILCIAPYIIISKGFIAKVCHMIPFTYTDISNVLQGNLARGIENMGVNFNNAIVMMTIYSIMLFALSFIVFNKGSFMRK